MMAAMFLLKQIQVDYLTPVTQLMAFDLFVLIVKMMANVPDKLTSFVHMGAFSRQEQHYLVHLRK